MPTLVHRLALASPSFYHAEGGGVLHAVRARSPRRRPIAEAIKGELAAAARRLS
jgi:hypothetical protein